LPLGLEFTGIWISSLKMSDLYELKSIDGKGLGAIAKQNIKRGTLILKEKPQIFDDGSDMGKISIFHQVN
jgi:hypothetical protein